jgi:hypothetical protein
MKNNDTIDGFTFCLDFCPECESPPVEKLPACELRRTLGGVRMRCGTEMHLQEGGWITQVGSCETYERDPKTGKLYNRSLNRRLKPKLAEEPVQEENLPPHKRVVSADGHEKINKAIALPEGRLKSADGREFAICDWKAHVPHMGFVKITIEVEVLVPKV